ncbi:proline-rich protein 7 [Osmerus eperlanus]|uniref:proline-rich protein 7 n=1 Tax=Osmerus eperlanus TaxID=29151 RepID=UPI002E0EF98F
MVMSPGTSTFLACFAGFWLVWALIVMLCCFCSFLQRQLKRRRDQRLREQCLRTLETEPHDCLRGYPSLREAPQFCPPHTPYTLPQGHWAGGQDTDVFGKPPCYEEAVLMEDPPPPYSEVLADPRGGTYTKPAPRPPRDLQEHHQVETSKPPPATVLPDRAYSSLIRLPTSRGWDSLGHLFSTIDLNHNTLASQPPAFLQASAIATMPRQGRTHPGLGLQGLQGLRGLEQNCGLPTAYPLLGRSTAV